MTTEPDTDDTYVSEKSCIKVVHPAPAYRQGLLLVFVIMLLVKLYIDDTKMCVVIKELVRNESGTT